jgi:NADH-quinone oxidoreductase subunit L
MPITFWTFLIGGLALSGFPLVTAGFWSKDEILADAWVHEHYFVFGTLALAALLTAFYTMRQITLTFLGKPRTKVAEHAHETPWTMTLPLVILGFFSISYGWVGIPDDFMNRNFGPRNWFHDWVVSTLPEHIKAPQFGWVPLLTSLVVAVGGLLAGWLLYRKFEAGQEDPVKKMLGPIYKVLQNKYYFDEIYQAIFVKPAIWLAETFSYLWVDRKLIDGFLHVISRVTYSIGSIFRNYIDVPIINGFGDFLGEGSKKLGKSIRVIQTGRVQQYMLIGLALVFVALFYYIYKLFLP